MRPHKIALCAAALLVASTGAVLAQKSDKKRGAYGYAPGQQATKPGEAKKFAPGQRASKPGEAKKYAPGQRMHKKMN